MEKIIHHIWLGPYRLPSRYAAFIEQTKALHPDFNHRLWSEADHPPLGGGVLQAFKYRMDRGDYAFAADILRVAVVWAYGGIYLDIDMEPKKGFHGLSIESLDGLFHYNGDTDLTIPNDTIGLSAGHWIAKACLDDIEKSPKHHFGPHWLGERVRGCFGLGRTADHASVKAALKNANVEYLYSYGDRGTPFYEQYFKHHGAYLWSDDNKRRLSEGSI
jgi:glycosyl transferase-like sugar-binding protein